MKKENKGTQKFLVSTNGGASKCQSRKQFQVLKELYKWCYISKYGVEEEPKWYKFGFDLKKKVNTSFISRSWQMA